MLESENQSLICFAFIMGRQIRHSDGVVDMSSKGAGKIEPKQPLRVGVIGAGVMGSNHARVLAGLPGVQLVGVVDPLPAHRSRVTDLANCATFAGLDELVAEGIDAVTVAAPTHLHHEIALACIARLRRQPRP